MMWGPGVSRAAADLVADGPTDVVDVDRPRAGPVRRGRAAAGWRRTRSRCRSPSRLADRQPGVSARGRRRRRAARRYTMSGLTSRARAGRRARARAARRPRSCAHGGRVGSAGRAAGEPASSAAPSRASIRRARRSTGGRATTRSVDQLDERSRRRHHDQRPEQRVAHDARGPARPRAATWGCTTTCGTEPAGQRRRTPRATASGRRDRAGRRRRPPCAPRPVVGLEHDRPAEAGGGGDRLLPADARRDVATGDAVVGEQAAATSPASSRRRPQRPPAATASTAAPPGGRSAWRQQVAQGAQARAGALQHRDAERRAAGRAPPGRPRAARLVSTTTRLVGARRSACRRRAGYDSSPSYSGTRSTASATASTAASSASAVRQSVNRSSVSAPAAPDVQRVAGHQAGVEQAGQPVDGVARPAARTARPGARRRRRPAPARRRSRGRSRSPARAGRDPAADGEQLQGVGHLVEVVDAVHAVRGEQRLPGRVGAGQGARVRVDQRRRRRRMPPTVRATTGMSRAAASASPARSASDVAHRLEDQRRPRGSPAWSRACAR